MRLVGSGQPLTGLRVVWVLLLFWYEIWVFRHSVSDCQWPVKVPEHAVCPVRPKHADTLT
jgi:hypothetical protein